MKSYNIAVIPGDGTGPEVVREGIKAMDTAAAKFGFRLKTKEELISLLAPIPDYPTVKIRI
jgi:isocitrate/isopropylmalate dehydrogenase